MYESNFISSGPAWPAQSSQHDQTPSEYSLTRLNDLYTSLQPKQHLCLLLHPFYIVYPCRVYEMRGVVVVNNICATHYHKIQDGLVFVYL